MNYLSPRAWAQLAIETQPLIGDLRSHSSFVFAVSFVVLFAVSFVALFTVPLIA